MKFNLFRALKHDYGLLSCVIGIVISIGFSIYLIFIKDSGFVLYLSVLSAVLFLLAVYRTFILVSFYNHGELVDGVVQDVWFYKDRGRVTYAYEINGLLYLRGNAIMKTKETRDFVKGKPIQVLVNNDNHKKAIIANLYGK